MASVLVSAESKPALGDLRMLGQGDSIFVRTGALSGPDGGRYADAISSAVLRGADVRWLRR